MSEPSFKLEANLIEQGFDQIAGVDEVGRGSLSGPVTAAAVILDPANVPKGLKDSKKLTRNRREEIVKDILRTSKVGLTHVSVSVIDDINILQASLRAMKEAINLLNSKPCFVLVDGNKLPPNLSCDGRPIVKGDELSLSIAAASVVAKVARDNLMKELSRDHPEYGWEKNAGYPTKQHVKALNTFGVTAHHRRSFAPVYKILCQKNKINNNSKNNLT